jgi:hypothetical protein
MLPSYESGIGSIPVASFGPFGLLGFGAVVSSVAPFPLLGVSLFLWPVPPPRSPTAPAAVGGAGAAAAGGFRRAPAEPPDRPPTTGGAGAALRPVFRRKGARGRRCGVDGRGQECLARTPRGVEGYERWPGAASAACRPFPPEETPNPSSPKPPEVKHFSRASDHSANAIPPVAASESGAKAGVRSDRWPQHGRTPGRG